MPTGPFQRANKQERMKEWSLEEEIEMRTMLVGREVLARL